MMLLFLVSTCLTSALSAKLSCSCRCLCQWDHATKLSFNSGAGRESRMNTSRTL
ncbi:hypothetical protein BDR05DRAFT_546763 [Suillus weaverae]|nr:hypothetical protein BDR05DRAFT_546763 [Suillus weaverae]